MGLIDKFKEKSYKIYGDKYDYSLAIYKNCKSKIKIICKEHGLFEQTPDKHLQNTGCKKCKKVHGNLKLDFITESINIHLNKYDYSYVNYTGMKNKVKIICNHHGEFAIEPFLHLKGVGCKKCNSNFIDREVFIKKSREVHGDKYDYSLVEYKGSKKHVDIICKKHGLFTQRADSHYNGSNCPKCCGLNKTNEDFIEKCIELYGDRFDYSKTKYIDSYTEVIIICKKHGEFITKASKHLGGVSCKKCSGSIGINNIYCYLESNNIKYITEKTIDGCVSPKNKLLQFDIYLPDKNLYIEYDGEQHYKPIKFWGGVQSYQEQKIRDELKNNFCLDNNINLIRISYKDNINVILEKYI